MHYGDYWTVFALFGVVRHPCTLSLCCIMVSVLLRCSEWYNESRHWNTPVNCVAATRNAAMLSSRCHRPWQPEAVSTVLSRGWQLDSCSIKLM